MVRRTPNRARKAPENQLTFRLPGVDLLPGELIVDSFAGGGGASLGIEMALGRSPDIAINHDDEAIRMHMHNHPNTVHYQESVWEVNPREVTAGRPVGLLWSSPDCRHFSRAKGGQPCSPQVRGLAWVVVSWARQVAPRVICLENVPEFLTWGPLGADRRPIKAKEGETFRAWKGQLERLGYAVEYRVLNAADYGAPTSRKRIFLVARRDGMPIQWPEPTHGPGRPLPWRTAAECIDFDLPCPTIFGRAKPLAAATLRRVARGAIKYVIEDPNRFIVQVNHGRDEFRGQAMDKPMPTVTGRHGFGMVSPSLVGIDHRGSGDGAAWTADAPLGTITREARHALTAATLVQTSYGERKGQAPRALNIRKPLGTAVSGGVKHAVSYVTIKHYGGVVGHGMRQPLGTITQVDHHSLESVHLTKLYGTSTGADLRKPMPTATSGGQHLGAVKASGCLIKYYGTAGAQSLKEPLDTITSKDRHGQVEAILGDDLAGAVRVARFLMAYADYMPSAWIHVGGRYRPVILILQDGAYYLLTDLGLRMLQPHELALAQGFPEDYTLIGTKSARVAKIGNSVSPPVARALVRANLITAATAERIKETA